MLQTNDLPSWTVTEPEIMELDKYLSGTNAPDLEEDVRLCISSGAREMILDCSNLGYMTGAGARAFLMIARMMDDVGGKLSVRNLNGQPLDIFTACGLSAFILTTDQTFNISGARVA